MNNIISVWGVSSMEGFFDNKSDVDDAINQRIQYTSKDYLYSLLICEKNKLTKYTCIYTKQ